ncbi:MULTISPECIES: outer membrane beta-barrel protein [Flavobacterium]|uniref:Outer membrane beta-barrel protein n=2 Tax=Flavobacterium TaxID=237 RepID=A0A940XGD3_9FLAO|nr:MULTISPECIES: outer membrane beta-barrel protein [Flavobacterium]MBP4138743.1 outer membrane beta-barrel protein [Flavobacterium geliluteum]MDX6181220.1 outer membrane beta-barrel protein [Flavobacterium sp. Fl-33]MDX6184821.1 outer membrane beta-barrel protein [Flavobacterium sp. Fl-77]UFH39918.1 porin family protein [Flavobacterium sp. F-70]
MKKNLFLLGFMLCSIATIAQTETADKPESWYFKLGGSYFIQTAATEFPIVNGQLPNTDVYAADGTTLISRETNHGSFGEGFRTGLTAGYRFSTRLGVEMGINYYSSADKLMVETTNRLVATSPTNIFVSGNAIGKIRAWDLSPALVLFLGESKGFEPYTKVGVIVPIHGDLTIKTNREYSTAAGVMAKTYSEDVVEPNPTIGFMAAIGSSYKLGKKIALYAEIEYRNFTVHGKTKETTVFTENGVDKLNTPSTFRQDASYSAIYTNYVDKLTTSSNSKVTNAAGFDNTKATDDISSYVGISGVGLTFGLRYSL